MRGLLRGLLKFGLLLGVLLGAAAIYVWFASEARIERRWVVEPATPALPAGPEALAEGKRIARWRGCMECHGADLGGQVFAESFAAGRLVASNLTRGAGGLGPAYSAADWTRAIRHGLAADGRPLWVMPSDEHSGISDADLGRLIAYLQQLPPVDRELPPRRLGPLLRVLLVAGKVPLLAAERIDHQPRPVAEPAPAAQGAYVAAVCTGCHGPELRGGPVPGHPPGSPPAADLRAGPSQQWSQVQFAAALRQGQLPDGRVMDARHMPWTAFAAMSDAEVAALYAHLQQL